MKTDDFLYIDKDSRPWGEYYVIHDEKKYKIKRIEVNPSSRLSYQYHNGRAETWIIINGKAKVLIDGFSKEVKSGDTVLIPRKSKHRIENISNETLIFIEIQTGEYFDEDDIVRIEDDYNRIK
jgi:mannose-6-phosphate isomerase